jgi:class 3 adenylate cyclase
VGRVRSLFATELTLDEIGDHRRRDLRDAHGTEVRTQLERFRGTEANSAGDVFLATFDGPAGAIPCGQEIGKPLRHLGLDVRAEGHAGEVERIGDDIAGIAVHIGARISGLAGPGEVLVSGTVRDLVAGSGVELTDRGTHQLRGMPDECRFFAAE